MEYFPASQFNFSSMRLLQVSALNAVRVLQVSALNAPCISFA